jgi:hypothetical protein
LKAPISGFDLAVIESLSGKAEFPFDHGVVTQGGVRGQR